MTGDLPRGHRVARWVLERLSPDGAPLYCDLIEAYENRRWHSGRLASDVWFAREVLIACLYGQRDAWADAGIRRGTLRSLSSPGHAVRSLRRRPAYAITVVILVGVTAGFLGGVTGIARAIDLPGDPDAASVRVMVGTDSERGWSTAYLSMPEIADLESSVSGLEEVGVYLPEATLGLGRGVSSRPVSVVLADAGYFRVMGARTHIGRIFTEAEGLGREGRVAVLSRDLWRDRFASDPDAVGSSIEIAGRTYSVVGVMEADFHDAARSARTDVWLPLGEVASIFGPAVPTSRTFRWMRAVARVSPERAAGVVAEAGRLADELRRTFPRVQRGRGFAVRDLESWWFGRLENPLRIVLVAGIGLLVLVLGNLAVLFRVRGRERAPEMALRAALGAGRGALAGVQLMEAVILALAAMAVGIGVAVAFLEWGQPAIVLGLPYFAVPRIDVLPIVACALSIVPLAIVSGSSGREKRVGLRQRPARWLLALEAALAAVLLTAAGALVGDVREVAHTRTGYEAPGLLTAILGLTSAANDPAETDSAAVPGTAARIVFAEALASSATRIAGVESAALVGPSVLGRAQWHMAFVPEGFDPQEYATRWVAQRIVTTPGALATLGVALLEGRDLDWGDRSGRMPVAVVDERIARTFWPDGDALGRRFCGSATCNAPYTVVGVAEAAKHRGRTAPDAEVVGDVYLSYLASPSTATTLAVRTDGTAGDVVRGLRALVGALDPSGVLSDVQWMDARLRSDESVPRMTASLVAACAALATLLALVGTYGLVAFHLGRRWRDVALRMALGARSAVLARTMLAEAVVPVIAGALIGATGSLTWVPPLTRAVSRVGGIGGWSLAESATVLAILSAAGLGAALLPLKRLGRLCPMAVLRTD